MAGSGHGFGFTATSIFIGAVYTHNLSVPQNHNGLSGPTLLAPHPSTLTPSNTIFPLLFLSLFRSSAFQYARPPHFSCCCSVVCRFHVGLAEAGRHDEAVAVLRRARGLAPGDPAAHGNLAVALLRAGRLDEAGDAAAAAVQLAGNGALRRLARANQRVVEDAQRQPEAPREHRIDALWCHDADNATVQRWTSGRFSSCPAATAAGGTGCTGPAARLCPWSCGQCLAQLAASMPTDWASASPPDMPPLDLGGRCDLPRVDARTLGPGEFMQRFVARRQPVLLTGLVDAAQWPLRRWVATASALNAHLAPVPRDGGAAAGTATRRGVASHAAAAAYVSGALAAAVANGRNEYVNLDREPRDLDVREALQLAYAVPPPFQQDLLHKHCPRDLPRRWALFSAAGSGSNYHVDPLNTSAWNGEDDACRLRAVSKPDI